MQPIDNIICDTECERRKHIDELIKVWEKSTPIPYANDDAEKIGDTYIQDGKWKTVVTSSTDMGIINIKKQMAIYSAQTASLEKMKEVRRNLLKENEQLKLTIDKDSSIIHTNDRKVVYEEWAKDWLFTIGNALRSLYLLVLVLFIYYGPFIKNNEWKTAQGWIIPAGLILLPFLIYYIAIGSRTLYDKILWIMTNKVYKNAYV